MSPTMKVLSLPKSKAETTLVQEFLPDYSASKFNASVYKFTYGPLFIIVNSYSKGSSNPYGPISISI
jgi:hypothetical protein